MPTTLEELEQLRKAPRETAGLEFKTARTQWSVDSLCEYAVGIANEGGGRLILGITNDLPREIVGTAAFRDSDAIRAKVLQVLGFRIDIDEVKHRNGRVLVIHIPPRPTGRPLHYDGRYLMRVGESLVPMSHDQLRKIFEEGKPEYLSEMALASVSAEDVVELLDTQAYYALQQRKYPDSRDEVLEKLERETLIAKHSPRSYGITRLGVLLCARQLDAFADLVRKAPRVIVYDGGSKATTKLDIFGVKGYAVGFKELIAFVEAQLPQAMTNESLRERFKLPEAKADTVSRIIRDAIDARLIKNAETGSQSKRYRRYVPFWA